jgi:hypothetical protein
LAVVINAGAWVTAVMEIAVTVTGDDRPIEFYSPSIPDSQPMELENSNFGRVSNSLQRNPKYATAYRDFLSKRMQAFGAELHAEFSCVARLAVLLENKQFINETNRQLISNEIRLFIEAAYEAGVWVVSQNKKSEIISRCQKIALHAAMLM